MSNAPSTAQDNKRALRAIEAKLVMFTDLCREALEDRGLPVTGKANKDRKHLADTNPQLFKKLRDRSGIVMVGGTPT